MNSKADYQDLLRTLLRRNPGTWTILQQRGVTEETSLALDFFYDAASESAANELAAFLRDETDYSVRVEATWKGPRKQWTVEGTTRRQPVSLDVLDQWVTWMVRTGMQHGDCKFDGWGAEA